MAFKASMVEYALLIIIFSFLVMRGFLHPAQFVN